MVSPVCGLRPVRAWRLLTEKVPKPTRVTLSPLFKVLVTASTKESRASLACVLEITPSSAILATNSALFIIVFLLDCKLMCANLLAFAKQQNKIMLNAYFHKTLQALLHLHFSFLQVILASGCYYV